MSYQVPEVSVDYIGLDDHIDDELSLHPHESITNYFLDFRAEAQDYRNLDNLDAEITVEVDDKIHNGTEPREFTVEPPEYFEIQGLETVDAFEALDSRLDDNKTSTWKMVYTPESEDFLEIIEELENNGPVWRLDLMEDHVKSSIVYDPVENSFKVDGPFTSAESREATESHPTYVTANKILEDTGLDRLAK
ncbi:MAG: hypothetical protein R6V35_01305 [Candidatus Nanohaloarchaea archaeon]